MSSLCYYDALRVLREWHPACSPVWVHRRSLSSCYGMADYDEDNDRYIILIHREMPEADQVHALVHEWAHVLTWDVAEEDHDEQWGLVYSKLYQDIIEA